ncbi:hypothetical protein CesoFtcFv8_000443 [Champsocephalus esox]|uniref:Uncharacterized protein n=1 Tax=Champsocephalus esox TaxID=159716 RepID=A0AAN8D6Y2_9TELE|nr:hypothetical protein CesoFtcFv8_000443 [Champsocephalus esox]
MEATKIIPVDLQRAWNQSISSLESISSPPALWSPASPRERPLTAGGSKTRILYPPGKLRLLHPPRRKLRPPIAAPEKKTEEEEEEDEDNEEEALQEVQPLMPPPTLPPPPPGGRSRRGPVYLRSLMTSPGGGPHSRGPTQL